jgi:hypothetical protein
VAPKLTDRQKGFENFRFLSRNFFRLKILGSIFFPSSKVVNVPVFGPSHRLEIGQNFRIELEQTLRFRVVEFGSGLSSIRRLEKARLFVVVAVAEEVVVRVEILKKIKVHFIDI